jgi:hypothetical protein|tara:strand:- start:996 stop:1460 length:465 start_codon:yes stop_codon:yes gene_type:complete
MSDSEPTPSPQKNEAEPSTAKKPSLIWAIAISLVIFVMPLVFPIGSFSIVPKYKQIFADMLGASETLPEFTLLILQISDAFKNNLIITVPVYFLFSLICAGFIGFNRFFLSRKISMIVTVLAGVLFLLVWLGLLVGSVIALKLPLIQLMDKLGQ